MVSEDNSWNEVTDLFRARIADQVTSVTLDDASVVTVKNTTFAWPDNEKQSKSDFPVIIIQNEDADDEDEDVQYAYEQVTNMISIYVAATKTETVNRLLGKIYDSIKKYKAEFREEGVTRIKLIDKDNEPDEMGGIRVRKGYLTFRVTWRRSRF